MHTFYYSTIIELFLIGTQLLELVEVLAYEKCIDSGNSPLLISGHDIIFPWLAGVPSGGRTDATPAYASRWLKETKRQRNCKLSRTYKTKRVGFNLGAILLAGGGSRDARTSLACLDISETGLGTRHVSRTKTFYQFSYCLPLIFILVFSWKQDIFFKTYNSTADIPYITFRTLIEVINSKNATRSFLNTYEMK